MKIEKLLGLRKEDIFYGIGGEISKILTKDRQILQSFCVRSRQKYELAVKGL